MKRIFVIAFIAAIAVAISTTGFSNSALGDRADNGSWTNNSTWTDYDYLKWRGGSNGYLFTTSHNRIDSTDSNTCNRMRWSGTTRLYAKNATATKLRDFWSVGSGGDVVISAPADVAHTDSDRSAIWETTVQGRLQKHSYQDIPILFTSSRRIYLVNHIVTSSRYVGERAFAGPGFERYELICY